MAGEFSRRTVLRAVGAASVLGLAGCAGDGDGDGTTTPESGDGDGDGTTTPESGDGGQTDGSTETIELRIGSFTTEESFIVGAHSFGPWMEKLQNKVDNYTIEYEFLGAGAAGGGGELYDLAADGVVDIAIDQPSYQGGRMPLSNFIAIPGLFPPSVDGHRSANQALHEMSTPGGSSNILADEFSNLGVRSLMSYTDQPFQLGTKEKVTAIEDLNGQVVRTGGGTKDLTGEALGMSPTQLTAQDIHSALQSGTVDAEMTSVPAPWAFGWYDVLNYYTTNLNLGGFHCATVIGEDTLDELPSEVSDAMIEAGDEAVEEYATTYQTALEEEVIPSDKVAEEEPFDADSKYLVYETEAKATIEDAINSVADDWVQNQEEEGLAAGEALETFESLQQEYSNE